MLSNSSLRRKLFFPDLEAAQNNNVPPKEDDESETDPTPLSGDDPVRINLKPSYTKIFH